MAKRRMFSLSVVDTDSFIEMPLSSRLLYYELGMRADDDGFVDSWRKIIRFTGLSEDDMKVLIAKKFVIPFETGIIVIRHWRLNNYLQRDRITETIHKEELSLLELKDNVYDLKSIDNTMDTKCIHSVYTDKIRLDKISIDNKEKKENKFIKPTVEEIKTYCLERNNTVDCQRFYDFYESKGWMVGKNKMKDWKACVRTWEKNNKEQKKQVEWELIE